MNRTTARTLIAAGVAAVLSASAAAIAFAADGDLIIFDWSGYEEPSFHPVYVAKHGDSPTFTFFGDEDEAFEKMRSGFKTDLAHPCSQSVVKWREAGLLEPLDTSRIERWNDILPGLMAMKDLATTADGQAWFLPWDWGYSALTYNTEKVQAADVASLKAFTDPKFAERVSLPDNVDDAYALGALAIGMKDWTTMTDEQFQQASEFLRQVHKNVRTYWVDTSDIVQQMANGEIDLAWAWSDAATQLQNQEIPVVMKSDTVEGLSTWVCGYVKLKDGPGSDEKAYDFLNAIMTDEVADYLVKEWGYGHASAGGMAKVDPAVLKEKGYADVESFKANTLFQSPLPAELKQKMIAEFEKIKAGY